MHICETYICVCLCIYEQILSPLKKIYAFLSNISVTDIISALSDYLSTAFLLGMKRGTLVIKSLAP